MKMWGEARGPLSRDTCRRRRSGGDAHIVNGTLLLFGTPIAIQPDPAPDTTVVLPADLGTLTLNQQTLAADGTLTVDALSINLLGGPENVVVARSVCNSAVLS